MLALLAFFISFVIALCILVPIVGITLLIIGVILYHFTIGYVIELYKIYKERQKINIKAKPTPIQHLNQHTDKYVGDET